MEKLIAIQNELKVPKSNTNAFGKYKYRSAEDILEAVKPLLNKHKATVYLTDDIIQVGGKIFLKATATIHDGTEHISVNGFAETSEHKGMSAEQTTGTASSYARKYALNGLFLIDETASDPDSKEPSKKEEAPKKALNEAQAELLLRGSTNLEMLRITFQSLTKEMQFKMEKVKDELKEKLTLIPA